MKTITVNELQSKRKAVENFQLDSVRKDRPVILCYKTEGNKSLYFSEKGFDNSYNLEGDIFARSREVDISVKTY